jgi:glutathione peroxidase
MTRAATAAALLATLVSALVLAACGGGDDGDESSAEGAGAATTTAAAGATQKSGGGVLTGTQTRLNGEPDDLADYRGKVVLVVNTASECGFAPQFEDLERLYREKRSEGFVILGFPADDVVGQEPRSNEEIAKYCEANFGVTFPMFSKTNVVDDPVNPLFVALAAELGEPDYNFNKYLIDRRGRPLEHWGATTEPDDPELTSAIERQLASS